MLLLSGWLLFFVGYPNSEASQNAKKNESFRCKRGGQRKDTLYVGQRCISDYMNAIHSTCDKLWPIRRQQRLKSTNNFDQSKVIHVSTVNAKSTKNWIINKSLSRSIVVCILCFPFGGSRALLWLSNDCVHEIDDIFEPRTIRKSSTWQWKWKLNHSVAHLLS